MDKIKEHLAKRAIDIYILTKIIEGITEGLKECKNLNTSPNVNLNQDLTKRRVGRVIKHKFGASIIRGERRKKS